MANGEANVISTYGATDNLYKLFGIQGYATPKRFKVLYNIYAFLVITYDTFYMPFAYIVAIYKSMHGSVDLGAFFTTLQVTFDICGGTMKTIFLRLMLHKLHGTEAIIRKLDARCSGAEEIAEQKYLVHHGRRIVTLTVIFYLLYSFSTCLGAFVNGRPPYAVYFPFIDWQNSRWELYLASVLEFIMINLGCLQQAGNDAYPTVFVCILLSHMRILILRIKKLGKTPNLTANANMQELIMCIKDHKNLLELQRQIRPVISITVFIQFSLTATIFGITMLNIMRFSTDFSVRFGSCVLLVGVLLQSFPLCYYAQLLLNESSKLHEEIFHSQWVDQSPEYRKILVFYMHRSQSLMEFDAAKLFPITLRSFLNIAKFSFSLYTLIKKMEL